MASALPGLRVPIVSPALAIGRDRSNDLCLPDDEWISRRHCVIHVLGSMLLIEDRSRNGTLVNGQPVNGLTALPVPSSLLVGQTVLNVLPVQAEAEVPAADETLDTEDPGSQTTDEIGTAPEALLLVDIVESTGIATHNEPAFVRLVLGMGHMLQQALGGEKDPFLKCTGDGFCAAFTSASEAIRVAGELDSWAKRRHRHPVRLVVALHWGAAQRPALGDRTGPAVRALSDVDRLRRDVPSVQEALGRVRSGALILMTESLRDQMDEPRRDQAVSVGQHLLAGLGKTTSVYLWSPRSS